jgi:UDPglucose 6-dehydrogenase
MNISVIGTGYVGLVSGTCFAEMGNRVICMDNNPEKIAKLQSAEVTISESGLDVLFYRNIAKKRLTFTSDLKESVLNSDIVFLCLPTPQSEDGSADLNFVLGTAGSIGKILAENGNKDYKIIVNKSTVPVGTALLVDKEIRKYGADNFDIVSNPEFLRERFAVEDFMKPDRIVIGSESKKAIAVMRELYEPFVRQGNPIIEMDSASSEVTKYAVNSYLAMRITYMNELANFCEVVEADIDLVRRGIGTDNRIGNKFLFSGIGYGGSGFPKDINALIKTSTDTGSEMTILTVVDKVNKTQKLILFNKAVRHFGDLKGKHFAVWGIPFKPNSDDVRTAPSVVIINELLAAGATVTAYDPAANESSGFYLKDKISYVNNEYETLKNADALMILMERNEFMNPDFDLIKRMLKSPVIFDGRNIFSPEKIREYGFTYYSIGRS